MLASEMIEELRLRIAMHGDLPVQVDDDGCLFDVAKIQFSHTPDGYEYDPNVKPYFIVDRD